MGKAEEKRRTKGAAREERATKTGRGESLLFRGGENRLKRERALAADCLALAASERAPEERRRARASAKNNTAKAPEERAHWSHRSAVWLHATLERLLSRYLCQRGPLWSARREIRRRKLARRWALFKVVCV